jgi:4-amino-4-deoxy-L-arabinose transferase-like glycosyltransferase
MPNARGVARWEWISLVLILVAAVFIRVPTMDRILDRDEQDNLRRSIHGYHEVDDVSGELVFERATWQDAFFENRLANNPVLFGVMAKASLSVWWAMGGEGDKYMNRAALRVPSLAAGLASIAAMWWFMILIGMRWGGLLAAVLAAVHPFHINYSTQARGYGLVMLFVVLAACFAVLALREQRWRYWMGYGASLFGVLYAFPGGIYFVMPMAVGVAIVLLARWWGKGERAARAGFVRMAVVGVVTGVLYYQMMSPLIPQATADLKSWEEIPLSSRWRFFTYTQLVSGAGFVSSWEREFPEMGATRYVATQLSREDPLYVAMVFIVIPVLLAIGFWRFWRLGGVARVVSVVTFLSSLLAFSHHHFITHFYYYYWYLCYSVPLAIMLGAAGLCGLGAWLSTVSGQPRRKPAMTAAVALLFTALFVFVTWPGKRGRTNWVTSRGEKPLVVQRGKSNWVVYPDGRMLKLPVGEEIPGALPGGTPGHD